MASGIFAVLDDIALLADDVATSTKIATQKTAGILGDDLAVNAQKATGFEQHRELKVIWSITKGSLINKVIILPLAFLLSAFLPSLIPFILILGGLYLLYEGSEKIHEVLFHKKHEKKHEKELLKTTKDNVLEVEKTKIKAAVMTDFILSIEIIMLALGTVLDQPLVIQVFATTFVAFVATFGVYGLVALIVRIDNLGFWFIKNEKIELGNFFVSLMPKVIKVLSAIGTIAMILVGGGILVHNIDTLHHLLPTLLPALLNEFLTGLVLGFILLYTIELSKKLKSHLL